MDNKLMEIVGDLESRLQCNCDLDTWEPEKTTGHSQVCPIHKLALSSSDMAELKGGTMSWQESVMSQIEIDIIDANGVTEGDIVPYLNRQAEIAYKDGQLESDKEWRQILKDSVALAELKGRQEVVDFIHSEFGGYTKAIADGGELINILIDNSFGEDGSLDNWQAKLKEWGLKTPKLNQPLSLKLGNEAKQEVKDMKQYWT